MLPMKESVVNASLVTAKDARLQCSYICRNCAQKKPTFRWEKDGWPISRLRKQIQFVKSNRSHVIEKLDLVQTQIIDLTVVDPYVQGYYRCVVETDQLFAGNNTLLWLIDVSTMIWEILANNSTFVKLENKTILKLDEFENIFSISLTKTLKRNRLARSKFDLVVHKWQNNSLVTFNGSRVRFTAFYRNVTDKEKLRICRIVHEGKLTSKFNTTSLDCCMPSVTGEDTSSAAGEIHWPVALHGTKVAKQCPYSKPNQPKTAYRYCKTDFAKGPTWLAPETAECPEPSQLTKNLKKLAEVQKVTEGNKKATMKELRKLTRKADNFTNELDVGFSTDILENVVNIPDDQNTVLDDFLGTTSDLMNVNAQLLLESQNTMNTSTRVLRLLERISDGIQMNSTLTNEQENMAFGINIFKNRMVNDGLTILGFRNETTQLPQLMFSEGKLSKKTAMMAYVYLSPASLQKINKNGSLKNTRLTSFFFNKPVFFQTLDDSKNKSKRRDIINGKIVSVMMNGRTIQDLKGDEEIQNYFQPNATGRIKCVYWNFKAKGGKGDWSTKGCILKGLHSGVYQCSCNHMTNFAILLDVTTRPLTSTEYKSLSIVSYIGCIISLLGLLATVVTFSSFRNLRTSTANRVLLHLSVSLMMTMVIFLVGSLVTSTTGCKIISTLLHYFVLASFCWMVVEAFNIYRSFVVVFPKGSSKFLLQASIFAWGTPLAIVLTSAVVSQLQGYYSSSNSGGQWKCMVAGLAFYIAYLTPVSLILFINFLVLIITIISLGRQSAYIPNKGMKRRSKTKIAVFFSVLLGCTWIFGLIAIEDLKFTFQLLFCIFNSLQGFFIFIFFCAKNEDAKKEWKRVFERSCTRRRKVKEQIPGSWSDSKNQTIKMDYASSWPSESINR
eukprot:gene15071-6236_t